MTARNQVKKIVSQGEIKVAVNHLKDRLGLAEYNSVLNTYAKNQDGHGAIKCLKNMYKTRVNPSAVTFNSVLLANRNDVDTCKRILYKLHNGGFGNIRADVRHHHIVLQGLVEQSDACGHWLNEMKKLMIKPDVMCYTAVAEAFAKNYNVTSALQYLPKTSSSATSYLIVLKALSSGCCTDGIVKVLGQMEKNGMQVNVKHLTTIIHAFAKSGDATSAYRYFTKYKVANPDVALYNALLDGFCKCGNIEDALHVFDTMMTTKDVVSYNCVLDCYARLGDLESAEKYYSRMLEENILPTAITSGCMMRACAETGNWQSARDYLDKMREMGIQPDVYIFNFFISAHAHQRLRVDEVRAMMNLFSIEPDISSMNALVRCTLLENPQRECVQDIIID